MKKFAISLIVLLGMVGCGTLDTINEQGNVSVSTDDKNPALFITSPHKNVTNKTYTYFIEGGALDNIEVTGVYLSRNGSAYHQVDGTTNWSTNISDLAIGDNIIRVYALDKNGNTSLTQMVNIFVDTDAPVVSITSGPSSDFVTNAGFSISLDVDKNIGYYSVYGLPFSQFSEGAINIDINDSTTLKYYGSDGINTSSTQTVVYGVVKAIYVTTNGSDSNNGYEKDKPMLNIQKAIEKAVDYGVSYVYVQAGTYTPGAGLNTNGNGLNITNNDIYFLGGYDSSFVYNLGQSTLDGTNGVGPIISGINITNCVIDSFVITRSSGNGISISGNSNIITSDCTVLSNDGGGVCISGSYNTVSGTISGNTTTGVGGGVCISGSYNTVSGTISGNTTTGWREDSGGGVYISGSYNTVSGTVSGNTAVIVWVCGGGVYVNGSYNIISGIVSGNTAGFLGGGVCIWEGSSNTISGTITANTIADRGGGVHNNGSYTIISGTISGNMANGVGCPGEGSGVYNQGSAYWTGSWGTGNWVSGVLNNWEGAAPLP